MSEEIILEARDIWHSYEENDRFSLQGLDLKVKKGSKVAFMGANGSGKYFVSWKTCELQEKGTSGTSGQGGHRVSGPG